MSDGANFDETPRVVAYKLAFDAPAAATVRVHVSGDERYELWLDGRRVGRGPERGDRLNWFVETYGLDLSAGPHTLVARTWWLGPHGPSPYAQMTVRHGFLLAAEGEFAETLNTGKTAWQFKRLGGYECLPPGDAVFINAAVWHSGGRNATDWQRRGIYLYYGYWWLKRYEHTRPLPWQAFEDANEQRLRLLGVKMPAGDLHMYDPATTGAGENGDNPDGSEHE